MHGREHEVAPYNAFQARLALLMVVIHCVKPPSCGVPLGCVVGPGL
jgi:CBS-domain-containing membrane protein